MEVVLRAFVVSMCSPLRKLQVYLGRRGPGGLGGWGRKIGLPHQVHLHHFGHLVLDLLYNLAGLVLRVQTHHLKNHILDMFYHPVVLDTRCGVKCVYLVVLPCPLFGVEALVQGAGVLMKMVGLGFTLCCDPKRRHDSGYTTIARYCACVCRLARL